jgi:hypothetical protein
VGGDRVVEPEPALVDEGEGGGRGDGLGHGVDAEDRVGAHGRGRLEVQHAVDALGDGAAVAGDEHDGPGELPGLDEGAQGVVDLAEAVVGHPAGRGRGAPGEEEEQPAESFHGGPGYHRAGVRARNLEPGRRRDQRIFRARRSFTMAAP